MALSLWINFFFFFLMWQNKEEGYIENQQQNIADAIDLLPRLTTGIDVNIKFRRFILLLSFSSSILLKITSCPNHDCLLCFRIDDFEFTPECAIFDLLDIPLYHGWIVDPQVHHFFFHTLYECLYLHVKIFHFIS